MDKMALISAILNCDSPETGPANSYAAGAHDWAQYCEVFMEAF